DFLRGLNFGRRLNKGLCAAEVKITYNCQHQNRSQKTECYFIRKRKIHQNRWLLDIQTSTLKPFVGRGEYNLNKLKKPEQFNDQASFSRIRLKVLHTQPNTLLRFEPIPLRIDFYANFPSHYPIS